MSNNAYQTFELSNSFVISLIHDLGKREDDLELTDAERQLLKALRHKFSKPIEEGCRVKLDDERSYGTCGKPFAGHVLVQWDGITEPQSWRLDLLKRVD